MIFDLCLRAGARNSSKNPRPATAQGRTIPTCDPKPYKKTVRYGPSIVGRTSKSVGVWITR